MQKVLAVTLLASLVACSTGTEATDATQSQPPVIVVQAPPAGPEAGAVGYEALASRVAPTAGAAAGADGSTPGSEPYEVVALLREFDPDLTDPPKDQASEAAYDDLLSAFAVMDEKYLYGRMVMRAPMGADGEVREARFWLEQGENMVTVEVKVGSQNSPCELSDATSSEAQKVVTDCFWAATPSTSESPSSPFRQRSTRRRPTGSPASRPAAPMRIGTSPTTRSRVRRRSGA